MLKEQLQKQIEQEGKSRKIGFENLVLATVADSEYCIGAEKYAALWQAAEEKAARYEKALEVILNTNHDNYERVILKVKSLATDALTPKTGEDDR